MGKLVNSDESKEKQAGGGFPEKIVLELVLRGGNNGSSGGHLVSLDIGWEEAVAGVGTERLAEVNLRKILNAMCRGLEFTLWSRMLMKHAVYVLIPIKNFFNGIISLILPSKTEFRFGSK